MGSTPNKAHRWYKNESDRLIHEYELQREIKEMPTMEELLEFLYNKWKTDDNLVPFKFPLSKDQIIPLY